MHNDDSIAPLSYHNWHNAQLTTKKKRDIFTISYVIIVIII